MGRAIRDRKDRKGRKAIRADRRDRRGRKGESGPQGPSGEVTEAELSAAINGTSANTNGIATLDTPFGNDPLSLADGELLRAKLNELILNGRR